MLITAVVALVLVGMFLFLRMAMRRMRTARPASGADERQRRPVGLSPSGRLEVAITAQEFFGVARAEDGIIALDDRRYRAVVGVEPVNAALLSHEEADALQAGYRAFCDSQRGPYVIYVPAARIDPGQIIAPLAQRAADLPPALAPYVTSLAQSVAMWIQDRTPITRRHAVILEYDYTPEEERKDRDGFALAKAVLASRVDDAVRRLHNAGFGARAMGTEDALQLLHDYVMRDEGRGFSLKEAARSGALSAIHTGTLVRGKEAI